MSDLHHQLIASLLNQVQQGDDPHRPLWHVSAPVGLLNDPNGFAQFDGQYHLFYQWNPLACAHGAKCWGHLVSTDLVNWDHQPLALSPTETYESHGCYSGSGLVVDGRLELFYTGNVKYDDGSRTAYQCRATLERDGSLTKRGPVIDLPAGYTGHVRDPKVWHHDGAFYMVLGAQDVAEQGKVLLYRSTNLNDWQLVSELAGSGYNALGAFGYMWECPDLFHLGGQDVLVFSPQGLAAQGDRYANQFQAGYVAGILDYGSGRLQHGPFTELDLGFDFYAPQTTEDAQGRRLMMAWMGLPDEDEPFHPTIANGWQHQLTCPRELRWVDGRLYQLPVAELQQLRQAGTRYQLSADCLPALPAQAAELHIDGPADYTLVLGEVLKVCVTGQGLELQRRNWRTGEWQSRVWRGAVTGLQVLLDSSSIEIFINRGEAALSARFFIQPGDEANLVFRGPAQLSVAYWPLGPMSRSGA